MSGLSVPSSADRADRQRGARRQRDCCEPPVVWHAFVPSLGPMTHRVPVRNNAVVVPSWGWG